MLMTASLVAGSQLAACSGDDEAEPRTRVAFCEDWAAAACSAETVSACQAASTEACIQSQQAYCQMLVPATFSDAGGDACVDAVRGAYDDADLTNAEIETVRRLDGDCAAIVTGAAAVGEACNSNNDCDRSNGAACVRRGGPGSGTCQVPEEVGAGQSCAEPQQACPEGSYCDGSNCIAALPAGEACVADDQCAPVGYCGPDGECVARLAVGDDCTSDNECQSLLCYAANGERTCADLIRLSPAEDFCNDLR